MDELIGKAEIAFEQLKENNDQAMDYTLDTGGSIQLKVHYPLSDAEARARRVKAGQANLLAGSFDEKQNRADFKDAVAAWRSGDEGDIVNGAAAAAAVDAAQPPAAPPATSANEGDSTQA